MSKPQTSAVVPKGGNTKLHNSLVYIRQHWQLYALFREYSATSKPLPCKG